MGHLTLSELTQLIKSTLDKNLEPSYWIVAEIAEVRITQKGHCYLELVEKMEDQIVAKLRANIWAYTYRNLGAWFESMTGQSLKKGMKILANAVVQYHEVFGLSLVVRDIDPNFTLGEREKRKRETIERLVQDGVYDMNRDLRLPLVPQKVAVISSPTAAGLEDFVKQLNSSKEGYCFDVRLYRAIMQGEEAQESIIQALHRVYDRFEEFDVLVIIRGGGSQVDLDCFDSYALASHVAQFPLPVITGIGHERDETIVDQVAHTRMKTPTAVSEFLLQGFRGFEQQLDSSVVKLRQLVSRRVSHEKQVLDNSLARLTLVSKDRIGRALQDLIVLRGRLRTGFSNHLIRQQGKLESIKEKIGSRSISILSDNASKLQHLENYLKMMDPKNVMRKGYSISLVNGKPLHLAQRIEPDDQITTRALQWEVISQVKTAIRSTDDPEKD